MTASYLDRLAQRATGAIRAVTPPRRIGRQLAVAATEAPIVLAGPVASRSARETAAGDGAAREMTMRSHATVGSITGSISDSTDGSSEGSSARSIGGSIAGSPAGSIGGSIGGSIEGSTAGPIGGSIAGSPVGSIVEAPPGVAPSSHPPGAAMHVSAAAPARPNAASIAPSIHVERATGVITPPPAITPLPPVPRPPAAQSANRPPADHVFPAPRALPARAGAPATEPRPDVASPPSPREAIAAALSAAVAWTSSPDRVAPAHEPAPPPPRAARAMPAAIDAPPRNAPAPAPADRFTAVHIGRVDVEIVAPPSPAEPARAPVIVSAKPVAGAPLARGLTSHLGLRQS